MPTIRTPRVVGGSAAVLALAAGLITAWEGTRTHAYFDSVGVATICIGHTQGVHSGDVATKAQCAEYLRGDLGVALSDVGRCIYRPLTDNQTAALVSFEFNTGALCRSSVRKAANSGAPASEWCPLMGRYVYAGGHVLQGLVNRRAAEVALCLKS
jgi:lysozyme